MERREHRRLDIQLPIESSRMGISWIKEVNSTTVNISTGGVYFEITKDDFKVGDQLSMQMSINTDDKRFPKNSKIVTVAEVVRTAVLEKEADKAGTPYMFYGIAAKFSQGLKLTV